MDADVAVKLKKIQDKIKRIHDTDTLQTIYELFIIIFERLEDAREITGVRISD